MTSAASRGIDDAPHKRGIREGRPDAVDADTLGCQLHRHCLGESLDGVLGHGVDAAIGRANMLIALTKDHELQFRLHEGEAHRRARR